MEELYTMIKSINMKYIQDDNKLTTLFGKNKGLALKLNNYLSNDYCYGAFLIKGDWGIGKTYFITRYIEETNKINKDKNCFLHVSLNGLHNTSEINKAIFEEAFPRWTAFNNSPLTRLGKRILTTAASVFNISFSRNQQDDAVSSTSTSSQVTVSTTSNSEKSSLINDFLDPIKDTSVLVFDDLERCLIPYQELFGYISVFLESKDNKVILIANEAEMKNLIDLEKTKTENILAAILSQNVGSDKIEVNQQISQFNTLKEQLSENSLFDNIKEKIIFDEGLLQLDYSQIIPGLFSFSSEEERRTVESLIIRECHNNIRSIIFAKRKLDDFNKWLDQAYKKRISDKTKFDLEHKILSASFKFKYSNNAKTKSPLQNRNDDIDCAIAKFVENGAVLSEYIIPYIKVQETIHPKYDFHGLSFYEFRYLTDEEYIKKIKAMIDDFNSNEIEIEAIPSFLSFLDITKSLGFDIPLTEEKIFIQITNLLNSSYSKKLLDDSFHHYTNSSYLHHFKEIINEHNNYVRTKSISESLKSQNFEGHIKEIAEHATLNHCFLGNFEFEELSSFIDSADNRALNDFYDLLAHVYNFGNLKDFFREDLDNAEKLLNHINSQITNSEKKRIRNLNLKELASKLTDICESPKQ